MTEANELEVNMAAHQQLVYRLQRLWGTDPGQYWKEFRASGLRAQDVWPGVEEYIEPERLKAVPKKQPGKMAK